MLKNAIGKPVRGDSFFDREAEQRQLWRILDADDILLLAPRRVGKTSLMYRLQEDAGRHGFQAAFLSVASATDELAFVRQLFKAISKLETGVTVLQRLVETAAGRYLKQVKKVGIAGFTIELTSNAETHWRELGEALNQALDGAISPWLLLMDEVPVFILKLVREDPRGKRAREFLDWFRPLRQSSENVRWLLAGSIGLDTVTARLNVGDTVNDLNLQHLGPFTTDVAHRFLEGLGAGYDLVLDHKVRERIIQRLDWPIPYYLQLVFAELRNLRDETGRQPSISSVDAAFRALLVPAKKNYFDYWRQRLHQELGRPDDRQAIHLLNFACRSPSGVSRNTMERALATQISDPEQRDEKLRYLLDVLVNDGYLFEDETRYRFRSPLLREFWKKRVMQ